MGFLDFLKRDKPPEPEVNLEEVSQRIEADVPLEAPDTGKDKEHPVAWPGAEEPPTGDAPPPMDAKTEAPPAPPPEPGLSVPPSEPSPAPPEEPKKEIPAVPERKPEESPPEEAAPPPPAGLSRAIPEGLLDLPDFSDEDIAEVDRAPPEPQIPPEEPEPEVKAPEPEEPPEPSKEPEPPKEPVPVDHTDVKRPVPPPAKQTFADIKHGVFLSADEHFSLQEDVTQLRSRMRSTDQIITKLTTAHDQGNVKLKRIADSMNTVQERLIEIDSALFEE